MEKNTKSKIPPMLIIGGLFFIFGFATWLNGALIPYLKIACELTNFQAYFVTLAFYISFFIMALPCSWVLKKTGFKNGMMLGLFVMAIGALLFIPAAESRTYYLFLIGLFIIGTGLTILQTAANPYATLIGPIESAAKRISIMGICNKGAGILAPIILAAIILHDADALVLKLNSSSGIDKSQLLDALAQRVILPYTIVAIVLVLLGILIRFSSLPDVEAEELTADDVKKVEVKNNIFQFPNLILGVFALFLYVGVEVVAADTIGLYGQSLGIPLSEAKIFTAYPLIAMLIGYIIGILTIPKIISQSKALAISAITGIIFSIIAISTSGYTSVLFIALLGLANALMWPAIWPLAIHGLGKFTKTGSALLIMSIAGGALLPLVYGRLADIPTVGHQQAYWVLVPCYIFILFYSWKGNIKSSIKT